MWIELDRQLSYGYEPPGAHDEIYQEIGELWNRLAYLRGFKDPEEMEQREQAVFLRLYLKTDADDELPF